MYYPHRGFYGFVPSRGLQSCGRFTQDRRARPEHLDSERLDFHATEYKMERKIHGATT